MAEEFVARSARKRSGRKSPFFQKFIAFCAIDVEDFRGFCPSKSANGIELAISSFVGNAGRAERLANGSLLCDAPESRRSLVTASFRPNHPTGDGPPRFIPMRANRQGASGLPRTTPPLAPSPTAAPAEDTTRPRRSSRAGREILPRRTMGEVVFPRWMSLGRLFSCAGSRSKSSLLPAGEGRISRPLRRSISLTLDGAIGIRLES
jgi:hypothetical protein